MTLLLGLPEGYEWVVLLVVALLLFGGQRLAGMGKGAGRAIREFREEIKAPTSSDEADASATASEVAAAAPATAVAAIEGTTETEPVVSEPTVEETVQDAQVVRS